MYVQTVDSNTVCAAGGLNGVTMWEEKSPGRIDPHAS
jgi:hypothetical protein